MNFKRFIPNLNLLFFLLIYTACATTVPIKSVRHPTIDTSGIQRLAIRDFQNRSGVGGTLGTQLPRYLTDKSREIITGAGRFTIVAANDPNVEGIFTGEIRNITVRESQSEPREVKDKDGNVRLVITYTREVSLEFFYDVINARTGMGIRQINKTGSASSSSERQDGLSDSLTLARQIVDRELRSLRQDMVPTIVSQNVKLMKETSNDRTVKRLMKDAEALVKRGNLEDAIWEYESIALEYDSVAARTNAGILRRSIESEASATAQLNELFTDTGGLTGRAVTSAVNSIEANVPARSSIMIIKSGGTRAEQSRLDFVVSEITGNLVRKGNLRVVEFTNRDLLNNEANYQLSGYVSDNLSVSIGRQHGAQYIVLCSIVGQMSLRKLDVKVINIETALVVFQNSFDI